MSENTIFTGKVIQQPQNASSVESAPSANPTQSIAPAPAPFVPQPIPANPPSVAPASPSSSSQPNPVAGGSGITPPSSPPNAPSSGSLPIGGVLRAVLGIGMIVIVLFLLYTFVFSRFFKGKSENVTLTYWGLWEDEHVMQAIISDFHRENPTISINYSKQNIKQYRKRVLARIDNGTGPDIFSIHNTWIPEMVDSLSPLPTSVIKKEDFQNIYYPVVQDDLIQSGAIYGIPLNMDTLSLFINMQAFQAAGATPPKTWEEFTKLSRQLTVKDESNRIKTAGTAMGTYTNITHAPDLISLLLAQNGANLHNISETTQSTNDTLDFYTSFATDQNNVWDQTLPPSIQAFAAGNVGMFFGYSWDIFLLKAMNPNLQFSVVPVPHLSGKDMTIASYWIDSVSIKSVYQKEAMLFLQYLTRKEVLQKMYTESAKTRLFGELYPRVDLGETLKDNQLIYPFVSQANSAVSSYFSADTYDEGLNEQSNHYLEVAVSSIISGTSVETATDALIKGVGQVFDKYGIK